MALTLILCGLTVALMIFSVFYIPVIRIGRFQMGGYCFFAVLGAIALLAAGCASPTGVLEGILGASSVGPLKILVLFLSMTVFSIFLDELGFFRYLASVTLRRAGTSQKRLFFLLYVVVAVLTVFTSNDIIILTFTPFICAFSRRAGIRPLPYLFAEFLAANTWSIVLMIGNPTNIYIASFLELGFFEYIGYMWAPTLAAGLVSLLILYLLFRRTLAEPITCDSVEVQPVSERPLVTVGLIHLGICILLLSISSYIGLEMWWISLGLAISLFICVLIYRRTRRERPVILWRTVKRMPWELVPFMLSMFILVISLNENGVCDYIAAFLSAGPHPLSFGLASFFSANLINNIPMSVLFAGLAEQAGTMAAAYASIIGSNLGACLTPVGALAGIMWADILRRERVAFDLRDFIRIGSSVSIPSLLAAIGLLSLFV